MLFSRYILGVRPELQKLEDEKHINCIENSPLVYIDDDSHHLKCDFKAGKEIEQLDPASAQSDNDESKTVNTVTDTNKSIESKFGETFSIYEIALLAVVMRGIYFTIEHLPLHVFSDETLLSAETDFLNDQNGKKSSRCSRLSQRLSSSSSHNCNTDGVTVAAARSVDESDPISKKALLSPEIPSALVFHSTMESTSVKSELPNYTATDSLAQPESRIQDQQIESQQQYGNGFHSSLSDSEFKPQPKSIPSTNMESNKRIIMNQDDHDDVLKVDAVDIKVSEKLLSETGLKESDGTEAATIQNPTQTSQQIIPKQPQSQAQNQPKARYELERIKNQMTQLSEKERIRFQKIVTSKVDDNNLLLKMSGLNSQQWKVLYMSSMQAGYCKPVFALIEEKSNTISQTVTLNHDSSNDKSLLSLNTNRGKCILVIRGTKSFYDMLTDIRGSNAFEKSARYIMETLRNYQYQGQTQNLLDYAISSNNFIITGHSMGALTGIRIFRNLIMEAKIEDSYIEYNQERKSWDSTVGVSVTRDSKIGSQGTATSSPCCRVLAFGCPPLSKELSEMFYTPSILHMLAGFDFFTRLSYSSLFRMGQRKKLIQNQAQGVKHCSPGVGMLQLLHYVEDDSSDLNSESESILNDSSAYYEKLKFDPTLKHGFELRFLHRQEPTFSWTSGRKRMVLLSLSRKSSERRRRYIMDNMMDHFPREFVPILFNWLEYANYDSSKLNIDLKDVGLKRNKKTRLWEPPIQ